ncbi:thioredoxin family protein [Herbiconiux sp. L3-i23]|uniref:thioredoxin family protein n=1 Tax=Herbiconiux sp. L3-i23 TaxID=2905871 RepID=UPI002046C145|nr:thioredoxin family protein [Herbiconiux sp. L3-i23]BDI24261.1 hypothetical protein L3i23_30370 [Herbiconiux sp. L3-i23]
MSIQILHIEACPNWVEAGDRVQEAMRLLGSDDVEITFRQLTPTKDAMHVPFAGSPTILLDGEDLFPGAEPIPELACRVYATPTGLAGLPTVEQIVEAMKS